MYESNPVDDSFTYSEGTYNLLIIKYWIYIYLIYLGLSYQGHFCYLENSLNFDKEGQFTSKMTSGF